MHLIDRLRTLTGLLPDDATVQLSVGTIRSWMAHEGEPQAATPPPLPSRDLTVEEVGAIFGRAGSTVRGWCAAGTFAGAYRLNGRGWRIPADNVHEFQRRQRVIRTMPVLRVRPRTLGGWREV